MTSSSFGGAPRIKLLCALVASCFAAEGFANPTGPAVAAGCNAASGDGCGTGDATGASFDRNSFCTPFTV